MAAGLDILTSINITRVAQAVQDVTTLPQPLLWYDRAFKPQVSDDEITLREKFYVFAADIVAADSRALTRDSGEFTFETTRIAKIKHGFGISESQAQLLNRIEASQASAADVLTFESYVARNVANLILGIKQRIETMIVGMLIDGYSYDRLGIRLSGTWGMPADLKVTPSVAWSSTSATPISDMVSMRAYALRHYGENYNRVTMSFNTLQYVILTTQFQDIYRIRFAWGPVAADAILTTDPLSMATVVGNMCGMTVETYDGQYREHSAAGTINTPVRFQPDNIVIFSNSGDDNSSSGWDFAQGIIMETLIGRLGGTGVYGGFPDTSYGPVSYATQADPTLNPPGIVIWAVDRGAPRKNRLTCTAKLTAWTPTS